MADNNMAILKFDSKFGPWKGLNNLTGKFNYFLPVIRDSRRIGLLCDLFMAFSV